MTTKRVQFKVDIDNGGEDLETVKVLAEVTHQPAEPQADERWYIDVISVESESGAFLDIEELSERASIQIEGGAVAEFRGDVREWDE